MKVCYIILFFMPAFLQSSIAQTNPLKFSHLTTSDGLSQSSVFAILKDYKGFMWFATDEGVNKYDGYKFTVYKHDNEKPGTISNNSIFGLMEDAVHNLWVVSAGGLDRFDRLRETFVHYNIGDKNIVFRNIFQDSKGRIWLGSMEGMCLFDVKKGTYKFYRNDENNPNSLSHNYIYRITEDNSGDLWIGTRKGLNRFNPETEKFVHYFNEPGNPKSIGGGYIKSVYKDLKGNIWVGTQGSGIALFNRADNSFINFRHDPLNKNSLGYNDILSFTQDAKGALWIGTENGGLSIFDYPNHTFTTYQKNENDPFSLSGNSIYSLYRDDIGNIWAGTWSDGINFLPLFGDKFKHYRKIPNNNNSLSNNLVLSISSDLKNNIWIGTDGGGLNRFNPRTHDFTVFKDDVNNKKSIYNDFVLSVAEYTKDVMALGFHRGGIDLFDVQKQEFTHHAPKDLNPYRLSSPSINILYKDRHNNLWLGTNDNGGIFLFDGKTKGFTNYFPDSKNKKSINGSVVFSIYETKAGQLWIGGDKGLDYFDRSSNTFIHHLHDPKNIKSISNNAVYCIKEDDAGNLWVGTAGGLNCFDTKTKTFTAYTEKNGLPNNIIWGIEQDLRCNWWVSTNKGLSRFNPVTKQFRNYTISDGLQSNTFKPKAVFQSPGGEMFFGGVNGFNTFFPDSIKDNSFVPPVYFTDFQVFNKPVGIGENSPVKQSINEVKEIILNYNQSVFTIEFAALNYTQPGQNRYAYKLEKFDKEWNYVGNKRTATYTNLNPGKYVFKVRGSNNDGVWNETGTSVIITITPPFWLRWWFKLAIFLFISGSIISFYRFRMNIIQKQKLLLEHKVSQQTKQLVKSNDEERKARLEAEFARFESEKARQEAYLANKELEVKNKELEQFASVASHDLQEPLRTTSGFIDLLQRQYRGKLDEKADKYLSFISESTMRMKVLIKDLLDFSRIGTKLELKRVDCNIILQDMLADIMAAISDAKANIQYTELPVIMGYPTEIKLLFQNLLLNAIKFRNKDVAPQINISVQKKVDHWEFRFKDNGIGIEVHNRDKIFDIFQRLHTQKEYEGSGIGLSHCRKIVELHHGKIWVESVPGEGSVFSFTIAEKIIL